MSKEIEAIICEVCESRYKLVYDANETSGFAKFCCFCGEIDSSNDDKIDNSEELDD